MQPLGRLTGGAGGQSAYLHGGAIIAPTPSAPASTGIGSMLGGIVGGIGGGAVGGGTTFGLGAIPGVVAGSGAGSALGDALEQAITHGGKIDWGNVGQQGALGLAGGAVGGVAKGAAMGLKAAGGINVGLKGLTAAEQVAPKAGDLASALADIPQAAGKMSAAGKADSAANKLLASQYGTISKPVARSVNLNSTVGTLSNYGITKPADAERIANAFTGSDGLVSKAVRSAAGSADRVSTDGLRGVAQDALVNNQVTGPKANAFNSFLSATMNKLSGGANGTLQAGAHPNDVLDVVKSLESRAAELTGKGGTYHLPTSEDVALAKVHTALANELKDRLYAGANVSKVLTPELGNSLKALQPNNPKWANYVDNTVMKSNDIGALRSTMSPFVKISKAIGEADTNGNTFGGQLGNAASSGKGLINAAVNATVGSSAAKRAAAAAIKGGTGIVSGAGKVAAAAAPQVGVRMVAGALNPSTSAQTPATGSNPLDTPAATPADPTATQDSSGGAFSPAVLQAMAWHDLQTTGGKNLAKIQALDSMFGPNAKTKSTLSAAQQAKGSDIQDALSYLDTAQQQLAQLGGAQGPAGAAANIPVIGQFINPKAAAYDKTKIDIATAIAKALTGSKPAASVIRSYAESLPLVTDTPQVAAQKLANVRLELTNKGKAYGVGQ